MSDRIAGIPRLYLYAGSIIVSGSVFFFDNLAALRAGTSGFAQEIAMVCAGGMVIVGIYELLTNDPTEYDVAGPVVGLLVFGATGLLVASLFEFLGVW